MGADQTVAVLHQKIYLEGTSHNINGFQQYPYETSLMVNFWQKTDFFCIETKSKKIKKTQKPSNFRETSRGFKKTDF